MDPPFARPSAAAFNFSGFACVYLSCRSSLAVDAKTELPAGGIFHLQSVGHQSISNTSLKNFSPLPTVMDEFRLPHMISCSVNAAPIPIKVLTCMTTNTYRSSKSYDQQYHIQGQTQVRSRKSSMSRGKLAPFLRPIATMDELLPHFHFNHPQAPTRVKL